MSLIPSTGGVAVGRTNADGMNGGVLSSASSTIDDSTSDHKHNNNMPVSVPPAISVVTFRWDSVKRNRGAPDR